MTATMSVEDLRKEHAEQAERLGQDGQSIEDLAEEGIEEEEVVVIEGTTGQLSLAVGGRRPDGSEFRVRSAAVKVEGQYTKGEMVTLRVVARIDEIDFVDTHDEFGTVVGTKRVHKAKPISIERLTEDPVE